MTNQFVEEIKGEIEKIINMGGAVVAIKNGYQISMIEENAYRIAQEIESGDRKVVGLNCWETGNVEHKNKKIAKSENIDSQEKIRKYKSERDKRYIEQELKNLRDVSKLDEPVIPTLKNCILVGATIGEICGVLRSTWGVQGN